MMAVGFVHPKLPANVKSFPPREEFRKGYPKAPTQGAPNMSILLNNTSPLTAGRTIFRPYKFLR